MRRRLAVVAAAIALLSGPAAYAVPSDGTTATPSGNATTTGNATSTSGSSTSGGSAEAGAEAAATAPTVEIVQLSDATVGTGDLTVTVRITNPTSEALPIYSLRLGVGRAISSSRAAILRFMRGAGSTNLLAYNPDVADVPAKSHVDITMTGQRKYLPSGAGSAWGAIGLEVSASTANDVYSDRTMAVVAPTDSITAAPMAAVLTVNDDSRVATELTPTSTALTHNLGTYNVPGITVALDSTAASQSNLITALQSLGDSTEVILEADGNADVASIAQRCGTSTSCVSAWVAAGRSVTEREADALRDKGITARTDIAILDSSASTVTWDALAGTSATAAIAPSSTLPATSGGTTTPTARTSAGDTAVLVTDTAMQSAIDGYLPSSERPDAVQTDEATLSSLDARQVALALSATTYAERPTSQRLSVVTASLTDPNASILADLLQAAWITGTTVSSALDTATAGITRTMVSSPAVAASMDDATMTALSNASTAMRQIASIATDSEGVSHTVEAQLARLTSTGWDPTERQRAIAQAEAMSTPVHAGFTSTTSSTINIISSNADIPITLKNPLPIGVSVKVDLSTWDPRLISTTTTVKIPPNGSAKALVPIKAFGSGNVTAQVRVLDSNGNHIGTAGSVNFRIRANWEDMGTYVFCGFFGILLVVGIWRSLRRGRRSAPTSPQEIRRQVTQARHDSSPT